MNGAEIALLVVVGVLVAFYLMIIRPGQQEQNRQQQAIRDLQIGDEVLTTSGFFARVKEVHTPEEGPVELLLDFGHGIEIRAVTTAVLRRVASAQESVERSGKAEEA